MEIVEPLPPFNATEYEKEVRAREITATPADIFQRSIDSYKTDIMRDYRYCVAAIICGILFWVILILSLLPWLFIRAALARGSGDTFVSYLFPVYLWIVFFIINITVAFPSHTGLLWAVMQRLRYPDRAIPFAEFFYAFKLPGYFRLLEVYMVLVILIAFSLPLLLIPGFLVLIFLVFVLPLILEHSQVSVFAALRISFRVSWDHLTLVGTVVMAIIGLEILCWPVFFLIRPLTSLMIAHLYDEIFHLEKISAKVAIATIAQMGATSSTNLGVPTHLPGMEGTIDSNAQLAVVPKEAATRRTDRSMYGVLEEEEDGPHARL